MGGFISLWFSENNTNNRNSYIMVQLCFWMTAILKKKGQITDCGDDKYDIWTN